MKQPTESSPYPPELDEFVEALAHLLVSDYDRRRAIRTEGDPNERIEDIRDCASLAAAEQQTSESVSPGVEESSVLRSVRQRRNSR